MAKVKIKGDEFKPFDVEIKDLNLSERTKINDMLIDESRAKNFSFYIEVIQIGTDLEEDQINSYSSSELIAIAEEVYKSANKKKLTKSA